MVEVRILNLPPEEKRPEDKFLEMLSLPKFQRVLKLAARYTHKTGLETAFEVTSLPGLPFWIEDVRLGTTDRMEGSQVVKEIDGPLDFNIPHDYYFMFHFHPRSDEMAIPSTDDLEVFEFREKSDQPEYMGVGQVDNDGKVTIIVLRKPRYRLTIDDLRFYEEEVDKAGGYEGLQALLATMGLSSFLLQYPPSG